MENLLEVKNLKTHFPIYGGLFSREVARVYAVDGVDLRIRKGETLGLVGESGCGKSTLGRSIIKLYSATSGEIIFDGKNISSMSDTEFSPLRPRIQMIFQDPFSSLDPRMTVERILTEPFRLQNIGSRKEQSKKASELLEMVGLRSSDLKKYPHEFSGGQRQRIGIARAIALKPDLIIADEPVAALDVSVQAQVLNLLKELKDEFGLTLLFISHDLSVVKYLSDRVAVMYLGKVVELADSDELYKNPLHPYTKALISAIPSGVAGAESTRQILQGDVPSPINPPGGCYFHPRCPIAVDRCKTEGPNLIEKGNDHEVSCHLVD